MENKNRFAAEKVRQLREALSQVAPYQATEVSKQQAIRTLAPKIMGLRSKGYSWSAVAAMLSEQGVPVSVAALRTYLRRVREESAGGAPRTPARRSREGRTVATPPEPTSVVTSPSQARPSLLVSKPQPAATAPASVVAAQRATPAAPKREPEPSRSAFVPRPDTDDI
jgi:hypothetical protein